MSYETVIIGESVPVEIIVLDNSGDGYTGQAANISLVIQRLSDGYYWTGAAWGSATTLTITEIDATHQPGRYNYVLPAAQNASVDRYTAYIIINAGMILETRVLTYKACAPLDDLLFLLT